MGTVREIEFRGINHETGEFVYGYYTKLQDGARIYDAIVSRSDQYGGLESFYIHDSKTIGQLTGLQDKNGVKIFEGDIIECAGYFAQIRYSDIQCGFCAAELHDFNCYSVFPQPFLDRDPCQVIGNIHQNPELLEKS